MARMPMEPEAFGEQVQKILQRTAPNKKVELVGPMDLLVDGRHLGLENLYRMVKHEPERGLEIVERFLDRLLESEAVEEVRLPLSAVELKIMPRIQPVRIFEQLDVQQVAHVEWVNGTVIVFVIDLPQVTVSITVEQMIRWGLQPDDLEERARANLAKYVSDLEVQLVDSRDGGRAAVVNQLDGYDATRLLHDGLCAQLRDELGGDFYAAAPARDLLIALSMGPPEFVARIHERVCQDHRRLPYPIVAKFFVVTRDGGDGT